MTAVKLIACVSQNGVIGNAGDLIYKFPKDMKYFREATTGHTVVMGRKTWDSIPEAYRPLKDRVNLVLSKTPQETEHPNLFFHQGVGPILEMARTGAIQGDLWVIGGASIYEAFFPIADEIHLTVVNEDTVGDTKIFQDYSLPPTRFELAFMSELHTDKETGKTFTFQTFKRIYNGNQ